MALIEDVESILDISLKKLIGVEFRENEVRIHYQEPNFCSEDTVKFAVHVIRSLKQLLPRTRNITLEVRWCPETEKYNRYADAMLSDLCDELYEENIEFCFVCGDDVENRVLTIERTTEKCKKVQVAFYKSFLMFLIPNSVEIKLTENDYEQAEIIQIEDGKQAHTTAAVPSFIRIPIAFTNIAETFTQTVSKKDSSDSDIHSKNSRLLC